MKDSAFENFSEGVMEAVHDFARCQRPDGSFYGTGGQCKKGSPTGAKEKETKVPKAGTAKRKVMDAKADLQSAKEDLARKDLTSAERARATTMKNQAERDLKNAVPKDSGTKSAAAQEQLRQINTQEGRGGGAGRAPTAKEVRALDKTAKAADKKAEAADKAWRKAGMPKGEQQKEVRRLDKEAKALNKTAEKADKAFQKSSKDSGSAAKPKASPEEKAAKALKSAKGKLRMEANGLKEMRDMGIKDNRIDQAASRVRIAKQKVESLRDKAAKKAGTARPEKSSMTSRIKKEESDIRRQAGKGSAKAKQYTDLKKRIQEGKVGDPISARRQLSQLRSELKPASSNQ